MQIVVLEFRNLTPQYTGFNSALRRKGKLEICIIYIALFGVVYNPANDIQDKSKLFLI